MFLAGILDCLGANQTISPRLGARYHSWPMVVHFPIKSKVASAARKWLVALVIPAGLRRKRVGGSKQEHGRKLPRKPSKVRRRPAKIGLCNPRGKFSDISALEAEVRGKQTKTAFIRWHGVAWLRIGEDDRRLQGFMKPSEPPRMHNGRPCLGIGEITT